MDYTAIDWNEAWKQQRKLRGPDDNGPEFWDSRAPSFAKPSSATGYAEAFLKIMKPRKGWSILDMGCGGGTLALPMSGRVREITAVDFSEKMLEIVKKESLKGGIKNIRTIKAGWEDNWPDAGIGIFDAAIASRSLSVDDLQGAIFKLNSAARKRVYISTVVGDGPFDRMVFEAVGRKFTASPDYVYFYNIIYQMGIRANISLIVEKQTLKIFENHGAALNSYRWMLKGMTETEEEGLRKYLHDHLVNINGEWALNYKRAVSWAVIWWDKEKLKI